MVSKTRYLLISIIDYRGSFYHNHIWNMYDLPKHDSFSYVVEIGSHSYGYIYCTVFAQRARFQFYSHPLLWWSGLHNVLHKFHIHLFLIKKKIYCVGGIGNVQSLLLAKRSHQWMSIICTGFFSSSCSSCRSANILPHNEIDKVINCILHPQMALQWHLAGYESGV